MIGRGAGVSHRLHRLPAGLPGPDPEKLFALS
jgi:hypothetical protein